VRSYDWYLLPDEDRRRMLADHGKMARGYPDVRANTVASFSLGDYEWILAFEADELYRIVDPCVSSRLRGPDARPRRGPFYTGRRKGHLRAGRRPRLSGPERRTLSGGLLGVLSRSFSRSFERLPGATGFGSGCGAPRRAPHREPASRR